MREQDLKQCAEIARQGRGVVIIARPNANATAAMHMTKCTIDDVLFVSGQAVTAVYRNLLEVVSTMAPDPSEADKAVMLGLVHQYALDHLTKTNANISTHIVRSGE